MRFFVASALVWLAGVSPALAVPAVLPNAAAEAPAPELQLTSAPATATLATNRRRLGLGLPSLPLGPLLLEIDTLLGPVRLEFLSLDQLQFRGSLVRVLEHATPASSPSTVFDRTELLDRYVVAVPIIWF